MTPAGAPPCGGAGWCRTVNGAKSELKQVIGERGTRSPGPGLPGSLEPVIRRVAVVPQPPLLVPELVPGAVADTDGVRAAVTEAVAWLREGSEQWIAVGVHDGPAARFEPSTRGSFAGFGVDAPVALSRGDDVSAIDAAGVDATFTGTFDATRVATPPALPLPVLVAGWLRARVDAASVRVELVDAAASPAECRSFGERLSADAGDAGALLVLGDGSNRHGERAPSRPDARAPEFDSRVAAALADADADALAEVDPALARELGADGRAAWQVAAGVLDSGRWTGKLLYSDAPFGVAYHVATWERA